MKSIRTLENDLRRGNNLRMIKLFKKLFSRKKGPEYYLSYKWRWSHTEEELDWMPFPPGDKVKDWPGILYELRPGTYTDMLMSPYLHLRLYELEGWYYPTFPLASKLFKKYTEHPMLKKSHNFEKNLEYSKYYHDYGNANPSSVGPNSKKGMEFCRK